MLTSLTALPSVALPLQDISRRGLLPHEALPLPPALLPQLRLRRVQLVFRVEVLALQGRQRLLDLQAAAQLGAAGL